MIWRRYCFWPLDPLEGCWKEQSQSQATQTSDEHINAKPPTSEKPESDNQNPDFRMCKHIWRAEQIKETWTEIKSCCCSCSALLLFLLLVSWVFFLNPSFCSLMLVYSWINLNLDVLVYKSNRTFVWNAERWCVLLNCSCSATLTSTTQLHQIILRLNCPINVKTSYKSQFCFFMVFSLV